MVICTLLDRKFNLTVKLTKWTHQQLSSYEMGSMSNYETLGKRGGFEMEMKGR